MKKRWIFLCVIAFAAAFLTFINLIIYCVAVVNPQSEPKESFFAVRVVDLSGNPIESANVYVVETNRFYKTGADGFTAEMSCYIQGNGKWGTVTVCVFKDGYVDYVLYGCTVYADRIRRGPTVRLFGLEEDTPQITVYSENPPDDYSMEIMRQVKKLAEENGIYQAP